MITIADLKTRIAQVMHRTDLTAQMDNFVADAFERVNRRFGTAFIKGADTETLPAATLLFLWPAMQSANEFIRDSDAAMWAAEQFDLEAGRQNVTGATSATDQFAGEPPVINGSVPL
jgi:hypothetical protein